MPCGVFGESNEFLLTVLITFLQFKSWEEVGEVGVLDRVELGNRI